MGKVECLKLPTYEGESVVMEMAHRIWELEVRGRLDLFSLDIIRQVWEILPRPRWFACNVGVVTEVSPRGAEGLMSLFKSGEGIDRVVLMANVDKPNDALLGIGPLLSRTEVERVLS